MRDEFLRDRFVSEFHASWFIAVERRGEYLGTVVIAICEAHVRFHVAVVFHRQSGISNVVPVVRIVYLGEATFPPEIFMRPGRLVMYCANVLFGCVIIDELLGRTR